MSKRDYYEILGVTKNAGPDEIKKAYRQMALKYHPDKNPGNKEAESMFKDAAEAYDVLSNADKKAKYDRYGHAGVGGASSSGFSGAGMSMDDIFSHFGDVFGGHFSGFGGFGSSFGGSNAGRKQNRGSNLRVKVRLTLKEISTGIQKKIKVNKYITCPTCKGSGAEDGSSFHTCSSCNGSGYTTHISNTFLGQMQSTSVCNSCGGEGKIIKNKCKTCHGDGIIQSEEIITIDIPAGVQQGMQLSMRGKGNAAARGGINGDLVIFIEEEAHTELEREGNNLLYNLYLSFPTAALGGEVEIPTLESIVKIKIEPGTQPGKVLRLKGKGLPDINGYGRGDLLVNINVWIPKELTKDDKKTIEKLSSSPGFTPKPGKDDNSFFERMKNYFSQQ